MEVTVGDYGRMIFEMCLAREGYEPPDHWKSIMERAKPLCEQLLALNAEMVVDGKPLGYKISGYKDKRGKVVLSAGERVRKARDVMLGIPAKNTKKGDLIWLVGTIVGMYFGEQDPVPVELKTKQFVLIEHPCASRGSGGESLKIPLNQRVLKAPHDWEDEEDKYLTDEFWLSEAQRLGF